MNYQLFFIMVMLGIMTYVLSGIQYALTLICKRYCEEDQQEDKTK